MTLHSVPEAARLTGKSQRTLYKHIKSGTLSAQRYAGGSLKVDTAELIRVYGEIHDNNAENTNEGHAPSRQMQAEIDRLKEAIRERDRQNEFLIRQNDQLVRLLENQTGRGKSAFSTLTEALADRIRGK